MSCGFYVVAARDLLAPAGNRIWNWNGKAVDQTENKFQKISSSSRGNLLHVQPRFQSFHHQIAQTNIRWNRLTVYDNNMPMKSPNSYRTSQIEREKILHQSLNSRLLSLILTIFNSTKCCMIYKLCSTITTQWFWEWW